MDFSSTPNDTMSIYGIRGPVAPNIPAAGSPLNGGVGQARVDRRPANLPAAGTQPPMTLPATGATAPSVPVQPPAGTDPELWSVLSTDERAYFARLGAMGPLTYGRVLNGQQQPQAPVARGGRLDVKA